MTVSLQAHKDYVHKVLSAALQGDNVAYAQFLAELRTAKKTYLLQHGMSEVFERVRMQLTYRRSSRDLAGRALSAFLYEDTGSYVAGFQLGLPEFNRDVCQNRCSPSLYEKNTTYLRRLPDMQLDSHIDKESLLLYASCGCEFLLLDPNSCIQFRQQAAELGIQLVPYVATSEDMKLLKEVGWNFLVVSLPQVDSSPCVSAVDIEAIGCVAGFILAQGDENQEVYAQMGYVCLLSPNYEDVKNFVHCVRKGQLSLACSEYERDKKLVSCLCQALQQCNMQPSFSQPYRLLRYGAYKTPAQLYRHAQRYAAWGVLQLTCAELSELCERLTQTHSLERACIAKLWDALASLEFELQDYAELPDLIRLQKRLKSLLPQAKKNYVLSTVECSVDDVLRIYEQLDSQLTQAASFEALPGITLSDLVFQELYRRGGLLPGPPLMLRMKALELQGKVQACAERLDACCSRMALRGIELV